MKSHLWFVVSFMYAVGGMFSLLALFVRTATRFQWRIQKACGLAPQRLVEDEERYFKFMRAFYAATSAIAFVVACLMSFQVRAIDDKMRESDRLVEGINRYYDKRTKDFQQSLKGPSEANSAGGFVPKQKSNHDTSK